MQFNAVMLNYVEDIDHVLITDDSSKIIRD